MSVDSLKKLVEAMEMNLLFDNIEAEDCALCCTNGNGGTSSSGC